MKPDYFINLSTIDYRVDLNLYVFFYYSQSLERNEEQ